MRGLLDLIDQLPAASRYWSAVALDEELAEALLAEEDARRARGEDTEAPPSWTPPLQEWDLSAQLLGSIINELKALRQTTVAAGGGRPKRERPFPGARTARAEVEARMDEAYAADVGASFGF